MLNEIYQIDEEIDFIESLDDYTKDDDNEVKLLTNERMRLQSIAVDADGAVSNIRSYINLGDDFFVSRTRRGVLATRYGDISPWDAASIDELMDVAMKLLRNNSYASSPEKMMVWDDEADDYIEVTNVTGSKTVEVTGGQQEIIPELQFQNFMNAGANGPVNV